MKVVVYGATGRTGSRIVSELLARGHQIVAVARNATSLPPRTNVTTIDDNLAVVDRIAEIIRGADAVVNATAPPPDATNQAIDVNQRLTAAVEKVGGSAHTPPRLLIVGGAGSLFVAPGITLRDSGHLPHEWLPIVDSHIQVLHNIRKSSIDWTYFSPAAFFAPGQRTGKFRLGTDNLIVDPAAGKSHISMDDYAIAVADELEHPHHRQQRFTIGY